MFIHNDDDCEGDTIASSGYQELGGLLRASLRLIIRSIGSSGIGAFPVMQPQVILMSSEKISDLLDFRKVWKEASDTHGASGATSRLEKMKHISKVVSTAVPGFMKNTLCGSVVFGMYDSLSESYPGYLTAGWKFSFLFGAAGGAVHFAMFSGWDFATHQFRHMRKTKSIRDFVTWNNIFSYSLPGTFLAHTVLHGVLFSVYETSKQFLQYHMTREIDHYFAEEHGKNSGLRVRFGLGNRQDTGSTREEDASHSCDKKIESVVDAVVGHNGVSELVGPYSGSNHGSIHNNTSNNHANMPPTGSSSQQRSTANRDSVIQDTLTMDTTSATIQSKMRTVGKLFCSAIAGGIAGTISDGFAHYFEPLEKHGIRRGLWKVIKLRPPPLRALYSAIIPSSVGFVAYEFGKDSEN